METDISLNYGIAVVMGGFTVFHWFYDDKNDIEYRETHVFTSMDTVLEYIRQMDRKREKESASSMENDGISHKERN